jgi:hypothetical protein
MPGGQAHNEIMFTVLTFNELPYPPVELLSPIQCPFPAQSTVLEIQTGACRVSADSAVIWLGMHHIFIIFNVRVHLSAFQTVFV